MADGRILCPRCGSTSHTRLHSRRYRAKRHADFNVVARGHRCDVCGKEFVTIEAPLDGPIADAVLEAMGA